MKELVPLKKDLKFKTRIHEITTIDVEHDYKIKNDIVEGKLIISGNYKMTEASLIEEDFYHEIPFSIALGENIIKDSIHIEIEDFKYQTDNYTMSIDAVLEFVCDKEEIMEEEFIKNDSLEEYFKNDEIEVNKDVEEKDNVSVIDTNETINNITNNIIDTKDTYNTYKVYIVRQGDTIETICAKYNVKYEDIKEYNDLSSINIGDKIIIPYINND